jgi:hypothetical protein
MGTKTKDQRLYEAAREALMHYLQNPNPSQNQNSAAKVAVELINYYKPKLQAQMIKQETTVKDDVDISELLKQLGDDESKPAAIAVKGGSESSSASKFET